MALPPEHTGSRIYAKNLKEGRINFFPKNCPQEKLIIVLKSRGYFQNVLSTAALWGSQRSEI